MKATRQPHQMAPPSMNEPADTYDAWPGRAVYLPARPQDKEAARAGWAVLFPVVIIRQMTERKNVIQLHYRTGSLDHPAASACAWNPQPVVPGYVPCWP
jgi:hypothetical protein